ncbi:IS1595 family transposase [Flavobacterium sp.]|uniref:IS1595 family transposase n=1 Tax=Flavobacterium sp. TaxID=239 RepID=UPI00286A5A82|nr:IS1595 family transposase [Flavobacterium sp.]
MTILKFAEHFPDEESCKLYYKKVREKQGITCKKCQCVKHYWLKDKWQWQCSNCRFRTTLRSGTVMESSKLSFKMWFAAMTFMSFSKKGISALEMQRQLGHKFYEPIWAMMHKIRVSMGKRDDLYNLEDMVEFDEGYFSVETSEKDKANLKRGRGSEQQMNVAVMAESTPLEDVKTGQKKSSCRYFKMKVLKTHKSEEINEVIKDNIEEKVILFSDKSTSYVDIEKYVEAHLTEKSTKETTKTTLKWVHIAISNAKKTFLGVHHKMKGIYLQNYLDEFCYKLNRRYFGEYLFDRITIALVTCGK